MAYANLGSDGEIYVQTSYAERELIKQVPGAHWDPAIKVWKVSVSWATCVILRGVFGPSLQLGESINEWAWNERKNRIDRAVMLRTLHLAPEDTTILDEGLYSFQRAGVDFLLTACDCLLGDEMGTGKTIQALTALGHIVDSLPALVICPNSVKINWAKEAAKWLPEATPYILTGSATQKSKLLSAASQDKTALIIVNIEAMRTMSRLAPYGSIRLARCTECDPRNGNPQLSAAKCEVHPKLMNEIPIRTVIVDEAHRMKDPQSKQTRACWAMMHGQTVQRRIAMTGTPLANDPSDVWSIMHGVAKEDFPSKTKFVDRYALSAYNPYGMLNIVGLNPKTKDEFYKIFDPRFRRMPKALVLPQLPPKIREQRYVQMSPKQAKAYAEIEDRYVTRLEDGSLLVAPNNLTAQTRLMQLASSYADMSLDDNGDLQVKLCEPSPKIDELMDILEDMGDAPLVVAAFSKQLIKMAEARLIKKGIPCGCITGDENQYQREKNLEAFQAGQIRVLLFTVQAGGVGLTMTKADTIVFLQRSWSMIDNKQSEDRVHRIGSEIHKQITIIDIITQGTVEDKVQIPRLYEKFERLEQINRDRVILAQQGISTEELDAEENALMESYL